MGLTGAAFWLLPDGTVRRVATSHVAELLRDPPAFGWTRAELEAAYARHGEPLGLEGRARDELIRATVARGYVRLREHLGRDGCRWSLTVGTLDAPIRALLRAWLGTLHPEWKRTMPVALVEVASGREARLASLAEVVGEG